LEIHIILTSINTSIREIKKTLDSALILNKKYLDNFDMNEEKLNLSDSANANTKSSHKQCGEKLTAIKTNKIAPPKKN
jgi:hypothetical protein